MARRAQEREEKEKEAKEEKDRKAKEATKAREEKQKEEERKQEVRAVRQPVGGKGASCCGRSPYSVGRAEGVVARQALTPIPSVGD